MIEIDFEFELGLDMVVGGKNFEYFDGPISCINQSKKTNILINYKTY